MKYYEIVEELHAVAEAGLPFWVITKSGKRLYCNYVDGDIMASELPKDPYKVSAEELLHKAQYLLPCY